MEESFGPKVCALPRGSKMGVKVLREALGILGLPGLFKQWDNLVQLTKLISTLFIKMSWWPALQEH